MELADTTMTSEGEDGDLDWRRNSNGRVNLKRVKVQCECRLAVMVEMLVLLFLLSPGRRRGINPFMLLLDIVESGDN